MILELLYLLFHFSQPTNECWPAVWKISRGRWYCQWQSLVKSCCIQRLLDKPLYQLYSWPLNCVNSRKFSLVWMGKSRVILLDYVNWLKKKASSFFILYPHTSHLQQPLDVSCNCPIKRMFNNESHKMMKETDTTLACYNIVRLHARFIWKL